MRRTFFVGAVVGAIVFLQGVVILRLMPVRIEALEVWALAWGGLFGLTIGSTFASASQASISLTVAATALVLFYGFGAVFTRAAYRSFRRAGVVAAVMALLAVHVGLYLWVIRSVVA
jgi:hypothetical protein